MANKMIERNSSLSDHDSAEQLNAEVEREMASLDGQSVDDLMRGDTAPMVAEDGSTAPASDDDHGDAPAKRGGGKDEAVHLELKRGRIEGVQGDDVFVELAGLDGRLQGLVPLSQFEHLPRRGSIMDFVVERVDEEEGVMYLSREGAISQSTWAHLQKGSVVEARVVGSNKGGLELEMVGGIKAFMPASQVDVHHVDNLETLVGQKFEAVVHDIDRRNKKVVISRRKYLEMQKERLSRKAWAEIEVGKVVTGKVANVVEYGAFVDIGGIDGLLHITDMSHTRVDKPEDVVKKGDDITVVILRIDLEKKQVRLGLKQVMPDPWLGVADRIKVGDQISGRVLRTADFGAFVEVEAGVEGLLPISEMSWRRIHHPREVVKDGDVVRVAVLLVDVDKHRVTLSIKAAAGDPWIGAQVKYAADSLVQGTVKRTTDFGAFVELEPGIEGLVHISELAPRRIENVEEVVKVGESHQFRVLEIDEEQRKVKLSIRAVDQSSAPASKPETDAFGSSGGGRGGRGRGGQSRDAAASVLSLPKKVLRGGGSDRPLKGGIE